MRHDLQVEILKELMQQLDEGRNVDAFPQARTIRNLCFRCGQAMPIYDSVHREKWDNIAVRPFRTA